MTELVHERTSSVSIPEARSWLAELLALVESFDRARRAALLAERYVQTGAGGLDPYGRTRDQLMQEIRDVMCGQG